jgi:hypothetical protein
LSSWALLTVALSVNLYRLHLPRVWTVGALLLRCAKDFPFGKTDRELAPFFLSLSVRLPERCSSPRLNWALLLSPRRARDCSVLPALAGAPDSSVAPLAGAPDCPTRNSWYYPTEESEACCQKTDSKEEDERCLENKDRCHVLN